MIRFNVLGPVEVSRGGNAVDLGAPMMRRVLAVLLAQPGRPVSAPVLADEVWQGAAPPTARKTMQVYIRRLRLVIGTDRLVNTPAGYMLTVDTHEVDALMFHDMADLGRAARRSGDRGLARRLYREALGLWRGPAYGDVGSVAAVERAALHLAECRLAVLEDYYVIEVGEPDANHGTVIGELTVLVRDHPYLEGLRELLMLALYRAGRQSDSLALYRETRMLLARELGIEPGERLQRLHAAILQGGHGLAAPA